MLKSSDIETNLVLPYHMIVLATICKVRVNIAWTLKKSVYIIPPIIFFW